MASKHHKKHEPKKPSFFTQFSHIVSAGAGKPITFMLACLLIVVWGVSGPLFNFSDTWQLVINTGTTIITFLMVFLIQNTQNRDTQALHLKLDELIFSMEAADNKMIDLDSMDDEALEDLHTRLVERAKKTGNSEKYEAAHNAKKAHEAAKEVEKK